MKSVYIMSSEFGLRYGKSTDKIQITGGLNKRRFGFQVETITWGL